MPQYFGLLWTIKPGTGEAVESLVRSTVYPEYVARDKDGQVTGALLRTVVFLKDNFLVRINEFEGNFRELGQHMSRQKSVQNFQTEMGNYIESAIDISTPEGFQTFLRQTSLRIIVMKEHAPAKEGSRFGALTWTAKQDSQRIVEKLLREAFDPQSPDPGEADTGNGRLVRTVILMRDQRVIHVVEFEGDWNDVLEQAWRRPAVQDLERKLKDHLEVARETSDPEGAKAFFREASMRPI